MSLNSHQGVTEEPNLARVSVSFSRESELTELPHITRPAQRPHKFNSRTSPHITYTLVETTPNSFTSPQPPHKHSHNHIVPSASRHNQSIVSVEASSFGSFASQTHSLYHDDPSARRAAHPFKTSFSESGAIYSELESLNQPARRVMQVIQHVGHADDPQLSHLSQGAGLVLGGPVRASQQGSLYKHVARMSSFDSDTINSSGTGATGRSGAAGTHKYSNESRLHAVEALFEPAATRARIPWIDDKFVFWMDTNALISPLLHNSDVRTLWHPRHVRNFVLGLLVCLVAYVMVWCADFALTKHCYASTRLNMHALDAIKFAVLEGVMVCWLLWPLLYVAFALLPMKWELSGLDGLGPLRPLKPHVGHLGHLNHLNTLGPSARTDGIGVKSHGMDAMGSVEHAEGCNGLRVVWLKRGILMGLLGICVCGMFATWYLVFAGSQEWVAWLQGVGAVAVLAGLLCLLSENGHRWNNFVKLGWIALPMCAMFATYAVLVWFLNALFANFWVDETDFGEYAYAVACPLGLQVVAWAGRNCLILVSERVSHHYNERFASLKDDVMIALVCGSIVSVHEVLVMLACVEVFDEDRIETLGLVAIVLTVRLVCGVMARNAVWEELAFCVRDLVSCQYCLGCDCEACAACGCEWCATCGICGMCRGGSGRKVFAKMQTRVFPINKRVTSVYLGLQIFVPIVACLLFLLANGLNWVPGLNIETNCQLSANVSIDIENSWYLMLLIVACGVGLNAIVGEASFVVCRRLKCFSGQYKRRMERKERLNEALLNKNNVVMERNLNTMHLASDRHFERPRRIVYILLDLLWMGTMCLIWSGFVWIAMLVDYYVKTEVDRG